MPLPHCASLLALTLLFAGASLSGAAEPIPLGNGSTATVNEYLIETDAEGHRLLIVRATPDFDPEPYGQVPADNYARTMQQFCENLASNSWDKLMAEDIGGVRVRWDFTPSQKNEEAEAAGITLTRFHEALFELRSDHSCRAMPYSVRQSDLAPSLPSGAPAKLEYAEPGLTPGELRLTYRYNDDLLGADAGQLERAAIELCTLHADPILADRAKYYGQLKSYSVLVVFYREEDKGQVTERSVRFPVRGNICDNGLSEPLKQAIRETSGMTQ